MQSVAAQVPTVTCPRYFLSALESREKNPKAGPFSDQKREKWRRTLGNTPLFYTFPAVGIPRPPGAHLNHFVVP